MSKILQIEEEKVLALAEKCPQWKEGLEELFPNSFRNRKFPCGTIFYSIQEGDFFQLRHAPRDKQYCLTNLRTGFNLKSGRNFEPIYFHREGKETTVTITVMGEYGLRPVEKWMWEEHLVYLLEKLSNLSKK